MAIIENDSGTITRKPKVGIPRGLFFYKYYVFWVEMLDKMGCEVITSPETDEEIVKLGNKILNEEYCAPMRNYFGHLCKLIEDNSDLDYVFIPRYAAMDTRHYNCPYSMALPDLVKTLINPSMEILEWNINARKISNIESAVGIGMDKFGMVKKAAGEAFLYGLDKQRIFSSFLRKGKNSYLDALIRKKYLPKPKAKSKKIKNTDSSEPTRILLIGHPYNLYDPELNNDLLAKLEELNVSILTQETVPKLSFKAPIKINQKFSNFWGDEEELLKTSRYYLIDGREQFDGVIFISSNNCVIDSILIDLMKKNFKIIEKPFKVFYLSGKSGELMESEKDGFNKGLENYINQIKETK